MKSFDGSGLSLLTSSAVAFIVVLLAGPRHNSSGDNFVHGALPFGVQSNDGDVASSYATGMDYDPVIERLYVTGSSYGSFFDPNFPFDTKIGDRDCFAAHLQLPSAKDERGPLWLRQESYGETTFLEACTGIFVRKNEGYRDHFVIGHSMANPDMLGGTEDGAIESGTVFGLVLELDYSSQPKGGYLFQTERIQYPVSTFSAEDGKDIFIATIQTNETFRHSSYDSYLKDQLTLQPNPEVFGSFFPRWLVETMYSGILTRLRAEEEDDVNAPGDQDNSPKPKQWFPLWSTNIQQGLSSAESVYITDTLQDANERVLVSGFTLDVGPEDQFSTNGFLSSLDSQTGEIIQSIRTDTVTNDNNLVFGLCSSRNSQSSDVFVVGITLSGDSTNSNINTDEQEYKAFLVRFDASTLESTWMQEVQGLSLETSGEGTVQVEGISCAVTDDNELVYLAGTVKNGVSLTIDGDSPATASSGKHDVFVAQYAVADGSLTFLRQFGTAEDDTLARGEGLLADSSGNAILLVNTKGSFFREKSFLSQGITNDVAVFSVDRESGQRVILGGTVDFRGDPEEAQERPEDTPEEAIIDTDGAVPTPSPNTTGTDPAGYIPFNPFPKIPQPVEDDGSPEAEPKDAFFLFTISLLVCLIVASSGTILWIRHKRQKDDMIRRSLCEAEGGALGDAVIRNHLRNGTKDVYVGGGTKIEGELKYDDEIYLSEFRSIASGTTIRPLPRNRDVMYKDTLLQLELEQDEVFYGRESTKTQDEAYFKHESDRYHHRRSADIQRGYYDTQQTVEQFDARGDGGRMESFSETASEHSGNDGLLDRFMG